MKKVTFAPTRLNGKRDDTVTGYILPAGNGTLAIHRGLPDECPDVWRVSHILSGKVIKSLDSKTRAQAIKRATIFCECLDALPRHREAWAQWATKKPIVESKRSKGYKAATSLRIAHDNCRDIIRTLGA